MSETADATPRRPLARRAAAMAAMTAMFALVVAVVVVPWTVPRPAGGAPDARRYAALDDGASRLIRHELPDGAVRWESTVVDLLPGLRAAGGLPSTLADAVAAHLLGEGTSAGDLLAGRDTLNRARVAEVVRRTVEPDGSSRTVEEVHVLDDRGLFLVGFERLGGDGSTTAIVPALPLLPADLEVGVAWSAEGRIGASGYAYAARVTEQVDVDDGPRGAEHGCLRVESTFTVGDGAEATENEFVDDWCAGVGALVGDVDGGDVERYRVVSVDGTAPAALPRTGFDGRSAGTATPGHVDDWAIERIGSVVPLSSGGGATFAPLYLPTNPPTVVASTDAGGDVVALRVGDVGGVEWRLPTGGAAYGTPVYDARRGRLYVGASDGFVRAVDARGLFLWSAATDDNVAARPLVVDDVVVVGSEDGHAYGFDADTGERRWRVEVDGAIASGAARVGDVAVVGDDGGTVTAIDPGDGDVVWTVSVGDAVEAAVAAVDGDALVADRSGALTRLAGDDGDERWSSDAGEGWPLRTEPAVNGQVVAVIDANGALRGVDAATGDVTWERVGRSFRGAPAAAADGFAAVDDSGRMEVVTADGDSAATFDSADARGPSDAPGSYDYGPSTGGGALWLADDEGVVRRVGAPASAGAKLVPRWFSLTFDEPFGGLPVVHSPLAVDDGLVVFDVQRTMYRIDPATGAGERVTVVGTADDQLLGEPHLAGDLIVLDLGRRVVGIDAVTGAERWSHDVPDGDRFSSLATTEDTVAAVVAEGDGARLDVLDAATGAPRWTASTGAAALESAPVVVGDVVVAGAPVTAFDLDDGAERWRSSVDAPMAAPAVDERAGVVVFGGVDGTDGALTAIDVETGAVAWRRSLGNDGAASFHRLHAVDRAIVLPSVSGGVLAVDPADGAERWRVALPAPLLGNLAVIDDQVWAALETGQIVVVDDGATAASFEGLGTDIGAIGLVQRPVRVGEAVVVVAGNLVVAVAVP